MKIHSEKGVSAIEFALILPILAILTFGIIEFGVLLFDKAVITNASREGARYGIVYRTDGVDPLPITNEEIRNRVKDYANGEDNSGLLISLGSSSMPLVTDTDIEIDPEDPTERMSGVDLTVTVNFEYDFLILPDMTELAGNSFKSSLTDGKIPLQGRTVMRME